MSEILFERVFSFDSIKKPKRFFNETITIEFHTC